jgi:VWFA-related protein
MNWRWRGWWSQAAVLVLLLLTSPSLGWAPSASAQDAAAKTSQQAPAAKDAADQPSADEQFKIQSNVQYVTTPVTVFDSGGQFVYDLVQDEFKVFDNGQPQRIMQFDSELRKLSLVIVVETNDATSHFLEPVRPLGSLFSQLVMGPQGEVAVLTYSDHVDLPLDFTTDGDKLDTVLRGLQGRGSGMHLDDAITRAFSMLDHRPLENRKVAIIFSDGYNLGSKMTRSEIMHRAMNSNITIYGLGFSPVKGLWERPAKDPEPDLVSESVARSMPPNVAATPTNAENVYDVNSIPLLSILLGLGEEAKKPLFKSSLQYFARYSGGTYFQKWGKDTVQEALNHIATEIHSQYEIAYSPVTPIQPGFHRIDVEVRRPGAKVRARAGWFYQGEPPRGVVVR